ncbi:MAG: exodeoxyribonuclease V subunit gamma [Candidatus Jettenia caeni]|nr:MAG: exodeoxyribonuclease V subunit gamma [Candidatus Jettenia caeni]
MLSVKIGLYHPFLEQSFVDTIQILKKDNSLTPLAVVAPTNIMVNRLQECLAHEQGASFMNISFMNFSVLAHETCRYSGTHIGRIIHQSVMYECLIEGILKNRIFQDTLCKNARSLPALARTLFRVVQDLINANVCADDFKEVIQEGFIGDAEKQRLYGIAQLYDRFKQKLKVLRISNDSNVYHLATPQVSDSEFLRGFHHILTYGFYDLSGVELDFFREIFRYHPTTLFLPYQKKYPAFSSIKPFFESFVLGLAHDIEELSPDDNSPFPCIPDFHDNSSEAISVDSEIGDFDGEAGPNQITILTSLLAGKENEKETENLPSRAVPAGKCSIINVSGKRDEVWVVAKEILKLAGEGYKMEEIGVVARSLEPYAETIQKLFQENLIPFVTSIQGPLERYPLIKVIRQMLLLKRENYDRPVVMELLRSPYFKMPVSRSQKITPRPDLWDILSRRLGIRGGIECWLSRLQQVKSVFTEVSGEDARSEYLPESSFHKGEMNRIPDVEYNEFPFSEREGEGTGCIDEEEIEGYGSIPHDQITLLEDILKIVSNDLSSLPERASWKVMGQKVTHILQSYICIPSEGTGSKDEGRDCLIMQKIWELFDTIQVLDCLHEEVTLDQYIDTFIRACRQEGLPMGSENIRGVQVLDVLSARGLSFRALFVLGLNEKVFPRAISEEPFLRDHVRRKLTEVLGNYLPEKLRGFDEERILFYLMLNAARERIYLLYQRSDEAGKPRVPSHYLMDILQNIHDITAGARNISKESDYEIYVPRGIRDKLYNQEISWLTPKEVRIRMALDKTDPVCFMRACGMNSGSYERSQLAVNLIDDYRPYLTAYDGIVGDISQWWSKQIRSGFSPTTLETFGVCPFQFFMRKVLQLRPVEEPEKDEMASAIDIGNLYHSILMDFYGALRNQGYFNTKTNNVNPGVLLYDIARGHFTKRERQIPLRYPIIWEVEKEEILASLTNFVTWDLQRIEQTGYIPAYLEKVMRVNLKNDLPKNVSKILWKGKIDRIDIKKVENTISFRIVDYKSGRFLKENLMRSVVRGQKLQIPFYIIMTEYMLSEEIEKGRIARNEIRLEEASFVYVAQNREDKKGQKGVPEKVIDANDWNEYGKQCWDTVKEFLHYIREGIFPISPTSDNQKCEWCEFAAICRKSNQPLRFRLEHDVRLKKYHEIGSLTAGRKRI